jgi:WD40 repeat protein
MVPAHETAISALALNSDGTRLATASEQGTVIRIFSTATGKPLQELRRGKDR